MSELLNKLTFKWIFYAILCFLISLIFQANLLHIAPEKFFNTHQLNGQARVLGGIIADVHGLDKQGANLGKVYRATENKSEITEEYTVGETHKIFQNYPLVDKVYFDAYNTQYGLQGLVYSFLYRTFGIDNLYKLQYISSLLLSVCLVYLFVLYKKIYDNPFSILFLISLIGSPWFIAMGRNLYWSPFLWFLPALFAALLYLNRKSKYRYLFFILIALAIFIKSLSNYEYLTTVVLLACSVFIAGPFFDKNELSPRPDLKLAATVFAVCVFGFAAAFLVHAHSRGDTITQGIQNIYKQDIQRRTFGDPTQFTHQETVASLHASSLDVLKIYILDWPDKRRMILPGKLFLALNVLSLIGIAYKFMSRHPGRKKDFVLFVTFLCVPVSWFVFAKGHAYTQTHINFVLWYIGFIPALLYVSFNSMVVFFNLFVSGYKKYIGEVR